MEDFLRSCRRVVKEDLGPAGPGIHVVLGNEACDLDSMVSSLVFAYFLSKSAGGETLAVPLLNIHQSELVLRSDNIYLLQQTGLSADQLLFRDQVDLRALHAAGRLQLTLVDHNVLPSSDRDLEGAVVQVIDHHHLERSPSPSCLLTVEMVGSCATLITEHILLKAPEILDQQLAQLLYGKVTPKDRQYAETLETLFPSLPQRGALFTSLQKAKFDVTGLNTEQMLLKDMKAVSQSYSVAVPVLYIPLEKFLEKAELEAELSAFCQKFGFDLLLLMTISFTESNEPIRELAVFSLSATCREQVCRYLEKALNPALSLCPIGSPHSHISAYQQGNVLASRKKLLPLVKDFLVEWDGDGFPGNTEEEESVVPPTPMNSLVEGCPLDGGLPPISAQDLQDKFSQMETSDL
ncbi:exopolyphosphatase PRUNE1 isoform X2 [Austrofundulus limnaeus]|uniref:Exopolyphosphatase PRUNE1 isoform X2 n=1 Tax=Austrofundulus limnaeus TaxID=52670 RepID=A0A2I4CVI3_AUSLI|nr:PREDICTED: protein prune homolog isoform X2 [Austrofundulus limnaeus]